MPRKSRKHSSRSSRASGSGSASSSSASSSSSSSSSTLLTPPAPTTIPVYDPQPTATEPSALFRPPGLLWASPPAYPSPWEHSGKPWAFPAPFDGQHPTLASPLAPALQETHCSPASLYADMPRSPSPAASSSRSDSSAGARAHSKASHVTAISIPPSPALLRQPSPLQAQEGPWFCHAPVPSKPISLRGFAQKTTRHSVFYFSDDLVTLNVDGCLFRVHRCILERESAYFRKLFAREAGRGLSDETAIELPQVTVEAFELLLRFLYFGTHEPAACTMEDWIALLAAATALAFPTLRERALVELEAPAAGLDALERLLLADRFDVARWRGPAYVALCMREHALQEAEAAVLGTKVAALVAQARERVLLDMLMQAQAAPRADKAGNALRPSFAKDVRRVERIVEDVFGLGSAPASHMS